MARGAALSSTDLHRWMTIQRVAQVFDGRITVELPRHPDLAVQLRDAC